MSKRLLFVDDDQSLLAAYKRVLHRTPFEVITALGEKKG